jgi:aminocarboxymuconate-semialdehyde decarboxylase
MGYTGLGPGNDELDLIPVLRALADASLPVFFHTNYALPDDELLALRIVLPHAGDTLSSVFGHIEACKANDKICQQCPLARTCLRRVLKKNVFFDGIAFDKSTLRAAVDAIGFAQVVFEMDHPLY